MVRETAPVYGLSAGAAEHRADANDRALTALGEEIMTLAEHLHAETHRWLMLIAEFDRRQGWKLYGFASCADWLAYSTGLDKGTAREKVRVARALVGLPETSAAMSRGELSFSQVRALTRVADGENEQELLEHARSTSASGLERLVRSWRRLGREDEAALEARRHAMRYLTVYPDDQGMYQLRALLDPEAGAVLMRAVEAALDAQYRGSVPDTTTEQRRADALALIAERVLAVGFGGAGDFDEDAESEAEAGDADGVSAKTWRVGCADDGADRGRADGERADGERADGERADGERADGERADGERADGERADGDAAHAADGDGPSPASADRDRVAAETRSRGAGCRADRYLVVLHVDEATLDPAAEPGRSELEDGTRVSAETARRLACDAQIVRVVHGVGCKVLRVEAKTRTVPPRMRRELEIRDRGCRFPGCGARLNDSHHIEYWADGGPTRLDNLILLCKTHHRLLHEGGFKLEKDPERPGRPAFFSPRGIRIPEVPPRMTLGGPAIGVEGEQAGAGRAKGEWAKGQCTRSAPRWEVEAPLAVYLRALESLA